MPLESEKCSLAITGYSSVQEQSVHGLDANSGLLNTPELNVSDNHFKADLWWNWGQ